MKIVKPFSPAPPNPQLYFENKFGAGNMPEMLRRFAELLTKEDGEGAGLKEAKAIRAEFLRKRKDIPDLSQYKEKSDLKLPHLNQYLFSTELNPPIDDLVHQDMNAPLSHYFIHTSLKSYFTGNYVFEKYSNVPIVDALKQGVRVVELDLMPCGKDDICVSRRWNWEKPLKLQKCLDSIKDHAFSHTSSYPVIVTFKDGLKPDLQSKATQMLNETFQGIVYHHDPDSLEEFPSPAQLRNMILISRRPPTELLFANVDEEKIDVHNGDTTQQESVDQDYLSLVSFHVVEPRGMLLKALTDKAELIQRPGWYEKDVISFTQKKFLRTRPKKKNIMINAPYKPQRAWMHGAQMIALSRQEDKEKLWLMQGMFRANGGCGYVKKPHFLLNDSHSGGFNPTVNPVVEKTLKVKVYMGDGWSVDFKKLIGRLKPYLYVMMSIAGVPHDEKIVKTTVKKNEQNADGFSVNEKKNISAQQKKQQKNKIWTWGEEFTFPLAYPALALLSIQVYSHDITNGDGFGGQTCLPVSELKEGIRAVPLYDENGKPCSSTMLLMRFRWS